MPRMHTLECAGTVVYVYVLAIACIDLGVYMGRQAIQTKIDCVPTKLQSTCH